jgi:hypothetical protein
VRRGARVDQRCMKQEGRGVEQERDRGQCRKGFPPFLVKGSDRRFAKGSNPHARAHGRSDEIEDDQASTIATAAAVISTSAP